MDTISRNVVIVGGGFAGVNTAQYLRRWLPADWQIILFSQENHIVFTPLLGDVVGASINPMHVVWPVRQMLTSVDCRRATVVDIDTQQQEVVYEVADGQPARQAYDTLILAVGSAVNFDIIPGMAAHGWPLKTMGDALALRNHVIGLLERAEVEDAPEVKKRLLSAVVVGGGFSGVEIAGELYDLMASSCRYYRRVDVNELRVAVLEARERILPELPESLSEFALKKMRKRGIDVRVGAMAAAVTERGINLKDGTEIDTGTAICTIGITARPLVVRSGLPLERNRIKTSPDMRVEGYANVWALGDCAKVANAYDRQSSPPTAQFATRQAKQLAANIARVVRGEEPRPFFFKPLGALASIGNHKAVAQVMGMKLSGLPAWILWRGIYLGKMPTLVRKVQIAFDWLWQLIFPRDIVQLEVWPTERFGRAHYETGQYVFKKGEPADRFYMIEGGRAGVYLDDDGPMINTLGPGDHFGEAALLSSVPRSASVRAEEALDVLTMGRTSFAQLTGRLGVLRTSLEQSYQRRRAAQQFLLTAKDHPRLTAGVVRDVMSRPVLTLLGDMPLGEAVVRSREGGRGAYPVLDERERMVGICTRSDFYHALLQMRPTDTPLRDVMHPGVTTVCETDTLDRAMLTFLREPIKRAVVVSETDATHPVGILTPFDIVSFLSEEPVHPGAVRPR